MTLLAVDDDPVQIERLRAYCASIEYPKVAFIAADSLRAGLHALGTERLDIVIADIGLPDGSGLEILRAGKELDPFLPIVVLTSSDDARRAVDALKEGADDYLVKPVSRGEIERLLVRIQEKSTLIRESLLPAGEGPASLPAAAGLVYRSDAMAGVMGVAARSAASDATVLISGESGTGKELVARFIHGQGKRRERPFVAVNLSALPESLIESELFGHARGAFTGASGERMGLFEAADGGTLFLDEVGEMPLPLQVKLLRTIQFGEIERVGENAVRRLDVRIIAATNRNLPALVQNGKFREDLYYRINVIGIAMPPLRQRKVDIPLLVEVFLARYNAKNGTAVRGLSHEAFDRLMRHRFPGNVRELENIVERAVVLCRGDLVLERDLPRLETLSGEGGCPPEPEGDYEAAMRAFEGKLLKAALLEAGGNQSKAARALGIGERRLRSRLLHLGIEKG